VLLEVFMAHSTKSYSKDLRQRVVEARLSGLSVDDVSAMFRVSRDCVYRWVKRQNQTGDISPKQRGGYKQSKITDMVHFEAFARANAHSTLLAMKERWEDEVSLMCLSRALKRLGWTRKKNKHITANATQKNAKNF
jgi:transposase